MSSARTADRNFTSVNERAMLDGVYFFSFEFNKVSDTVQKNTNNLKPALFCGKHAPYPTDASFS